MRGSEHLELVALEAEFALGLIDGDFVFAAPAGGAVTVFGLVKAIQHAFHGEVGEAVDFEEVADFFDGAVVGDELGARGEIDAVEAGMANRGAGDAEVNFLRTGVAEGAHLGAGGGAADDGVFDNDDAFAFNDVGDDVELHGDGAVALELVGHDEGAADEAVGDDAFFELDAGFNRIAEGGGTAGVGHRHDVVGVDGGFAGELAAHGLTCGVDGLPEHFAGDVGEVDVLEAAHGELGRGGFEAAAVNAVVIDADDFAGLDLADVFGVEGVKRAGFTGDNPIAVELAENERADAPRIAGGFDAIWKQKQEAVGPLQMLENVREWISFLHVRWFGEEVDDDFGVGGALEDVAMLFVLLAEEGGVDQIAVVGDGDGAHEIFAEKRLGVADFAGTGGGIADVADGGVAGEFFAEETGGEDLADEAHADVAVEGGAVGGDDAGGFLAAMLLRKEAVIADL